MEPNQINGEKLKSILASKIYFDGCGQASIRKVYNQYKSRNYIDFDSQIVHEFETLSKELGLKIIAEWEGKYPKQLAHLNDTPLLLFCRGNTDLLKHHCVTVVGTRKHTRYGEFLVNKLIEHDVNDTCLVSGLAYGIDSYVHERSLMANLPTIAVVAGGVDVGYPQKNQYLYDKIVEEGLILAEFPPGVEIGKGMFPIRNRILASLSSKCVVIEAPVQSGSLITAHLANSLGRETYAIPGQITQLSSEGTNMLIKEGATPLCSTEDFRSVFLDIVDTHNRLLS